MLSWRTYRSILLRLWTCIIIAGVAAGCAPKLPPEPAWERDARMMLDQADALFAKRQFEQAAKTVDAFFVRYPKSRSMDRALLLMGDIRLTLRDYPRALNYFKDLIEKFPASLHILDARYKLGICYFELKEYDLAIANLEDRSKVTDPTRLRRIGDMLAYSYIVKKNYAKAVAEYAGLAAIVTDEKQQAGYRDRVREIIEKNLSEDELKNLSEGTAYPSDLALLRLAGMFIEQRRYRDAAGAAKEFLARFPTHPEKVRAEMLLTQAEAMLTSPQFSLAALVPQSGPAAFFGDKVLRGIQLAVNDHNSKTLDRRVELIVRDTEGSPEKAVLALTEVASKGIIAAVGPLLTKEAEAIAPELTKLQVPVITPAASGPRIGMLSPWLFRNAITNVSQAAAAAQYALGLRLKKFVILHPDDAYGRDLAMLFSRELSRKAEILATVAYPPETNDFGPWIKRIIEIDLRSRRIPIPEDETDRKKLFQEYSPSFDAIYLPGYADRVGLLIPQLAFYNITGVALIGSNSWHSQELIERAGRHAEGAVFVDGFAPESKEHTVKSFVDAYRSAYQDEPDVLSAQAYDSAMMILSLIREGKETPLAIRDGLLSLRNYPGISGFTSFEGNGEAHKTLFFIRVEDGAFVPVAK